jgi:hypothetical protein
MTPIYTEPFYCLHLLLLVLQEAKRQLDAKEQTAGDSKTDDNKNDEWQDDADSSNSTNRKQNSGDDHEESKSSCGDKRK